MYNITFVMKMALDGHRFLLPHLPQKVGVGSCHGSQNSPTGRATRACYSGSLLPFIVERKPTFQLEMSENEDAIFMFLKCPNSILGPLLKACVLESDAYPGHCSALSTFADYNESDPRSAFLRPAELWLT